MFGNTKREKRFSALTTKALKHFEGKPDYRTKDLQQDRLNDVLHQAAFAAVSEVVDGLKGELFGILRGKADDKKAEVVDAFRLGQLAVDRLVGVTQIKDGSANWMVYAVGGLDQPETVTAAKEKAAEDVSWVGELGQHEESPESEAYAGTEGAKSFRKEHGRDPYFWEDGDDPEIHRKVLP